MYYTSAGERILLGAERRFFTASLAMIVDLFATDIATDHGSIGPEFGVAVFDDLQRNQKLFSLYTAARGLLRPDEPMPHLTAFIEAAVAVVYEFAKDQMQEEINDPELQEGEPYWRTLILDAAGEQEGLGDLPDATDDNIETWDFLLECLAACVLWDNDYELHENLDLPPNESKHVRDTLGMPDEYYTAIAHDPPDSQVNLYLDALMGLTPSDR